MEMQQLEQGSDGTGLPSVRELVSNGPLDRPLPMPKGGKFEARAQQPPHTLLRHRIHRTRCTHCTCYTVARLQAALEHSPSCDLHTFLHSSACTLPAGDAIGVWSPQWRTKHAARGRQPVRQHVEGAFLAAPQRPGLALPRGGRGAARRGYVLLIPRTREGTHGSGALRKRDVTDSSLI